MTNVQRNVILVADDEATIRNLNIRTLNLKFKDMKIESFPDGISLEKRLQQDANDVAVVITDRTMPGMSGSEIIKKYATKPEYQGIAFILAYSGHPIYGEQAVLDGAFQVIRKPYNIFLLNGVVEDALKRSKPLSP